ncbi:hypothetical protein [Streptomyces sp. NPDC058757]|uniref:hypothetical protein n=1 Tax=Streptomyces sp. NPDC058757 TaxID=3346626 RepID=UPI003677EDC1
MEWWLTDSEGIVACWLLVFAGCNVLRGAYRWFRNGDERRRVTELIARGIPPARASYLLGGMTEAAETAVCVLAGDGVVKVSPGGELRPTHRGGRQADRALRALAEEIRRAPTGTPAKLYEIPDGARFARFRELVEQDAPAVRSTASGRSRALMMLASAATALGMGAHAALAEAPMPFVPEADRALWLYAFGAAWMAQSLVAALWPSEGRRRWRALDACCREEVERARAALPGEIRRRIALTRNRPKPPPPDPRVRARSGPQGDDDAGPDGPDADSCGSCGGCGGD